MNGPLWTKMHGSTPCGLQEVGLNNVPKGAGVYAWYRDGKPIYVGKAKSLFNRLHKNHLRMTRSITNSAFRRNVAESLKIAYADDLKNKRHLMTDDELLLVNRWVQGCQFRWLTCQSHEEAKTLEHQMKAEFKPVLTER